MSKLQLYKNIKEEKPKIHEQSDEIEKKSSEIPDYFKDSHDLDYSITYSGNNRKKNFFSYVILSIIVIGIIIAILSTLYGNSILKELEFTRYR